MPDPALKASPEGIVQEITNAPAEVLLVLHLFQIGN